MQGKHRPLICIEHCEDHLSRWLLYEYEHVVELAGRDRVIFTNVRREEWCRRIRELGATCYKTSIAELISRMNIDARRVLILDPQASKELQPSDTSIVDVVVVGGILGDHPPRGRTRTCITSRLPGTLARNIGRHQFSIDGAVYVYLQVENGRMLRDIPYVLNPSIRIEYMPGVELEVTLPFAYPLVDGKPLISKGVLELLKSGLSFYEAMRLND